MRSKLEQQRQFFAEVDGFSLASESEGSCASVAKKTARAIQTREEEEQATATTKDETDEKIFRRRAREVRGEEELASASAEKIFPSPSAAARAPAPTTPGTKLALTSEWLRAIPESFSPGEAVDEEDEREGVDGAEYVNPSAAPGARPARGTRAARAQDEERNEARSG